MTAVQQVHELRLTERYASSLLLQSKSCHYHYDHHHHHYYGFGQSDLLWFYYNTTPCQELSLQGVRFSSACQFMVLCAERQAYMTWVQFNITIVPVISTVCYNIWFFICGLIKHTLRTVTAVTLWEHSSSSFFMLSLAQSQFHTTWGLLTASHYY